jgi:hypothetical protein
MGHLLYGLINGSIYRFLMPLPPVLFNFFKFALLMDSAIML